MTNGLFGLHGQCAGRPRARSSGRGCRFATAEAQGGKWSPHGLCSGEKSAHVDGTVGGIRYLAVHCFPLRVSTA